MNTLSILQYATAFRSAIEQIDKTLFFSPCMKNFPRGCCGDTSLLLGEFLLECGVDNLRYTLGRCDNQSHAWLERNGEIIDITGDQFTDGQRVFVGKLDAFYSRFELDFQRNYTHFYDDSSPNNYNLLHDYKLIVMKCK